MLHLVKEGKCSKSQLLEVYSNQTKNQYVLRKQLV